MSQKAKEVRSRRRVLLSTSSVPIVTVGLSVQVDVFYKRISKYFLKD